ELVRIEGATDHTISFDVKRDFPPVGCEIEVIRGEIMRRERVVRTAILERQEIDFPFLETLSTFEQHVFEKVRFAGMAKFFVSRTHLIPDHVRDNRRSMHFLRQDDQTVREDRTANIFRSKS